MPKRHPLLVGVEDLFLKVRSKAKYLTPSKRTLVDIFVSKPILQRALDVANRVFLDLESCGYPVQLARDPVLRSHGINIQEVPSDRTSYEIGHWRPSSPTIAYIGTVAFSLSIYEMTEEVEMRYVNGQYERADKNPPTKHRGHPGMTWTTTQIVPSGRLCLMITSPYQQIDWKHEYRERKAGELPSLASDLTSVLEGSVQAIVDGIAERDRLEEQRRKEYEEYQRRMAAEEDRKQQAAAVKSSADELHALAEAWSGRVRIEAFFADAEQCAEALPEAEQESVKARIRRARALLNPKTPLERLLSWRTPEERLPESLRAGLPDAAESATPASPAISQGSTPRSDPAPPKTYWETRHWWQRR